MLLDFEKLASEGESFDVVVIGAGGAGMSAALFAAIDGARVLLVERTEHVGGTTAYSGGTTWIPGTRHAAAVWAPVSLRKRPDGSTAVFPHFLMDRGKPGMLVVDKDGRRFVNETASYHLLALAMQQRNRRRIRPVTRWS
jgi:glycine/D-amino acid oxidase-like deaminating enzyme